MEKYLNQIESSDAYNRLHNCFSEFIERENCLEIEKTKGKNTQYVYRIDRKFPQMVCFKIFLRKIYSIYLKAA
jgi:hypothetical protein